MIHVPARLQPYYDLIQAHCDERRSAQQLSSLYNATDPVWQTNGWTALLLDRLLVEIRKHDPEVAREDLRRVDLLAAGHTDWHRKLSLSCAELAARASVRK